MEMKGVYIYGRKEVNVMTKNEYIASIMLEAAELLKADTKMNNLNEGALGEVLASIAGTITLWALYSSIKNTIIDNNRNKK